MNRVIAAAGTAVAALFAFTLLLGSWYVIDQGELGVQLRNGAVVGVAQPGLGFKVPVIDSVVEISTRTEKQPYTTAAYSRDIQAATLALSVNYRLNPADAQRVYAEYQSLTGAVDRIVTPRVLNASKIVFGRFNAATAIAERGRLTVEIEQAIRDGLDDSGIIVEAVQIENIDFSDAFENSVEQRMLAEVEVAKLKQNWEREKVQADIVRTQADAQRDAAIAQATGQAEAIKLRGEAEAESIRARGEALRDNPDLVALVQAERWNGTLPTTMLPAGTVPFLDLAKR